MGNTSILATAPARQKNIGFDPQTRLRADHADRNAGQRAGGAPRVPAHSPAQLIELARARPGLVTFASSGHGSAAHLAGELFKTEAKADLVHVPYKKPGPALQDVVGGHVQMMFAPAALGASPHPQRTAARARGRDRHAQPAAAERPTLDELGLAGFDATTWYGLAAPLGTPKEVIDILYHSTARCWKTRPRAGSCAGSASTSSASSPREFESYIRAQIPKWAAVIKSIAHTH